MRDWDEIRTRHGPAIWATIYRVVRNEADALDCLQEVFTEAFTKDRQGSIENLPGLLRWLAVRRALDVLRKRKGVSTNDLPDDAIATDSPQSSAQVHAEFEELIEVVRRELNTLPSNQAEAFWMCCVEQATYAEAAESMQLSTNHVGVLVHRARSHLKIALAGLNPIRSAPS
ncbi:MAG: sigma-70 family RNA polymerase sigma factor [Planctomycetota bacterium]